MSRLLSFEIRHRADGRALVRKVVRVTLALEVLLICGEGGVPYLARCLPLGGSHLAQLGLCLGSAIAVVEIWEVIIGFRRA